MTLGNSARPAPWTVIGYRKGGRPIHLLAGGSAAEDDDDDLGIDTGPDDDGPDDEAAEAEAETEEKPKPAAKAPTQADLEKVAGALEKEREANKAHRAKIRTLEAEARAAKKAADAKPGEDEATAKAVEDARSETENRFKPMIVNKSARVALLEAGLPADTSDARVKKLLRLLDLSDIDVDEDGEVSGLDRQIDQIKDDFPELFRKAEPEAAPAKIRAPRVDAAPRSNAQPVPKTTGERHAAAILGNL
jgi:hypothetical protein